MKEKSDFLKSMHLGGGGVNNHFSRCGMFILILGFFNFGFDSNCTSLWQLFTFYCSEFRMPRKECDLIDLKFLDEIIQKYLKSQLFFLFNRNIGETLRTK